MEPNTPVTCQRHGGGYILPYHTLGFELGADDYLVKPFSLRELTLRVAALLKRNIPVESDENIKLGDLNIDLAAHRVFVESNEVTLTAKEFDLHYSKASSKVELETALKDFKPGILEVFTEMNKNKEIYNLITKRG